MNDWLRAASGALAQATGDDEARYGLDEETVEALLDIARIAAHDSGDRVSAPLLCYMLGVAKGRHDTDLKRLIESLGS